MAQLNDIKTATLEWRESRRIDFTDLSENDNLDVSERLARYVRFDGPNWEGARLRIMDRLTSSLQPPGQSLHRSEFFGPRGEVNVSKVQAVLPHFNAHYLEARPADDLDQWVLLQASSNRLASLALPGNLNINMGKPERGELIAYRTEDVSLYVSPLGFQLFNMQGQFWPAASTRSYPKEAMHHLELALKGPIVIIQDVFEGTNFSHFLFDWIPRLIHFINFGIQNPTDCKFLMGGAPGEFHFHIIKVMCEIFSLIEEQFVFPAEPQVWRVTGSVYFFSDTTTNILHPAHMAHEASISAIKKVCSNISCRKTSVKKLYISRADTPLRRIVNEDEIVKNLNKLGFVEVLLSELPFLEQVGLIRGAEVIVAPHGMGLTHIAFHQGCPLVVELHNPKIGTDAYAFVAHALGFSYCSILGIDKGGYTHHFEVASQDVLDVLQRELPPGLLLSGGTDLPPLAAVLRGGVQSIQATITSEVAPARPRTEVWRHCRDDVTDQPDNNLGWLQMCAIKGCVYFGRCDVWIPADFHGRGLLLECADVTPYGRQAADLSRRDQWQTLVIVGAAKEEACSFVLRCDGGVGSVVYSSGWLCGFGDEAPPL